VITEQTAVSQDGKAWFPLRLVLGANQPSEPGQTIPDSTSVAVLAAGLQGSAAEAQPPGPPVAIPTFVGQALSRGEYVFEYGRRFQAIFSRHGIWLVLALPLLCALVLFFVAVSLVSGRGSSTTQQIAEARIDREPRSPLVQGLPPETTREREGADHPRVEDASAAEDPRPRPLLGQALPREVSAPKPAEAEVVSNVEHEAPIDRVSDTAASAVVQEPIARRVPPGPPVPRRSPEDWLQEVREASVVVLSDAGQGSGFFVRSGQGILVVTNFHVVNDAAQLVIKRHDGAQYQVTAAQLFPETDLALLWCAGLPSDQPVLELRGQPPRVGEPCYVYGAPLGLSDSLTQGIVSALRTPSELQALGPLSATLQLLQTDAAISPGNSGGPILDANGQVIGIATMTRLGGQNLNFGVCATEVAARIQRLNLQPWERVSPRLARLTQKAAATLKYWGLLCAVVKDCKKGMAAINQQNTVDPATALAQLTLAAVVARTAAALVAQFDTSDVDPRAVTCGVTLIVFFTSIAEAYEGGINLAVAGDSRRARDLAAQKIAEALAKLLVSAVIIEAVRLDLSRDYGVEFPSIFSAE
jgi:S1-C subfamily serine protease